jgi:outer membrane protein assembly factor BamB
MLVPLTLLAEDWPQFRGPLGQGHATGTNLPVEWGPEKNVAWRTELEGNGWSSPIYVQGRVYLTEAVEQSEADSMRYSLRVISLDAKTGKTLWETEVFVEDAGSPNIHNKNSHASPTPLIEGDRLYVHFGHQGTACLTLRGEIVWQNRELNYKPVHGGGCSPVLAEDVLVFSADGASDPAVYALDSKNGQLRWKFARPNDPPKKFAFCTPLVITINGEKQIISPGAGSVSALKPSDGTELWRVDYGDGYSVVPRPVFEHGLVFLSSGFDAAEALAIRPDGTGNVTETHIAWREKRGAPHTPSMLVVGDELYMVSDGGVASCLDAKTGEIHWKERLGGGYSSSPLFVEGKIYFVNEAGKGTVLAPGKTFTKLGENGFPERTLASYAAGENALFVRTEKALYRVEAK